MSKAKNPRRKTNGDFLNRFAVPGSKPTSELIPGFEDGSRPMLTFLLRALNGTHENLIANHLGFFLASDLRRFSTTEHGLLLGEIQGNPELFYVAVDSFCDTLRTMADMWIVSGKEPLNPGADTPTKRNVEDVQPGFEFSLFEWIDSLLLVRYPRYTGMRRDGKIAIKDTFPHLDSASPSFQFGEWESVLQDFGQMWAAHDFSRLLVSPYSLKISRCDSCKCYFAYDRNRLRTVKSGVFCCLPGCKGRASVKRTERSREKRIVTAAEAWAQWEAKRRRIPLHEWVTEKVNETHGTDFGKRWFTQHREEIQAEMEKSTNAKG
jgi:hypothetical protein